MKPDSLLPGHVEGIIAHIEDVAIVLLLEKLELIGNPFRASPPPGLLIEGRFRAEGAIPGASS